MEANYVLSLFASATFSLDYQFIKNPAYNRDRGPVSVYGLRIHGEFWVADDAGLALSIPLHPMAGVTIKYDASAKAWRPRAC